MGIFSLQAVSGWAAEVKWSCLTSLIMTKVWGMLGTWFRFAGFSIHIFAYLVFLLSLLAAPFFLTRVTGFVKDPSGAFLKSKEQRFARGYCADMELRIISLPFTNQFHNLCKTGSRL